MKKQRLLAAARDKGHAKAAPKAKAVGFLPQSDIETWLSTHPLIEHLRVSVHQVRRSPPLSRLRAG